MPKKKKRKKLKRKEIIKKLPKIQEFLDVFKKLKKNLK